MRKIFMFAIFLFAFVVSDIFGQIIVSGKNLTEKLAWLQRSADSHNTYVLEVNANENITPHKFYYEGAINITIVLRGDEENRTLRLRSHGTMFTVTRDITFILGNNITLQGHTDNTGYIVHVDGGKFIMNDGATITGNNSSGVFIGWEETSIFEMTGGTISGNGRVKDLHGGGVDAADGTFTMTGGTISGNSASYGGAVKVYNATFNMRGGIITGNTATENGGGVYVENGRGTFNKTGGTITGYNSDQDNGNVIKDEAGNILARRGHAVYIHVNLRKETTAGPTVNLSNKDSGRWD